MHQNLLKARSRIPNTVILKCCKILLCIASTKLATECFFKKNEELEPATILKKVILQRLFWEFVEHLLTAAPRCSLKSLIMIRNMRLKSSFYIQHH